MATGTTDDKKSVQEILNDVYDSTNSALNTTATTSGTTSVDTVTTLTGGGVAHNAADSGNPIKIGGKYNSSAPTLDNGDRGDLQMDVNGNLLASLATKVAGEDLTNDVLKTEQRFSYTNITAEAQIKSGAGFLHTITISGGSLSSGAVTPGLLTAYDSLTETGTVIWKGWLLVGLQPTTIHIDSSFSTGLYIGFDGTLGNASVTVSYR